MAQWSGWSESAQSMEPCRTTTFMHMIRMVQLDFLEQIDCLASVQPCFHDIWSILGGYGPYFQKDLEFLTPSETSKACDKRHRPRWRSNNLAFTSATAVKHRVCIQIQHELGNPSIVTQVVQWMEIWEGRAWFGSKKSWIGRYQRYQGARRSKGCTPPDGLPQERTQDSECRRLELVGFTVVRLFLESIYNFFGLKKKWKCFFQVFGFALIPCLFLERLSKA